MTGHCWKTVTTLASTQTTVNAEAPYYSHIQSDPCRVGLEGEGILVLKTMSTTAPLHPCTAHLWLQTQRWTYKRQSSKTCPWCAAVRTLWVPQTRASGWTCPAGWGSSTPYWSESKKNKTTLLLFIVGYNLLRSHQRRSDEHTWTR